jgi:hypothetical protein
VSASTGIGCRHRLESGVEITGIRTGANRRPISRTQQELERKAMFMLVIAFLAFSTLLGLLILYLIKSAAGINIFPNYSLGIWGWFQ